MRSESLPGVGESEGTSGTDLVMASPFWLALFLKVEESTVPTRLDD
jgi:hypothetical protein